jgi:hypothetical protein
MVSRNSGGAGLQGGEATSRVRTVQGADRSGRRTAQSVVERDLRAGRRLEEWHPLQGAKGSDHGRRRRREHCAGSYYQQVSLGVLDDHDGARLGERRLETVHAEDSTSGAGWWLFPGVWVRESACVGGCGAVRLDAEDVNVEHLLGYALRARDFVR